MPIENRLKLFRNHAGAPVNHIRVSTLANYFFCAFKAYLQAAEGVSSPGNYATDEGTKIHDAITRARPPSALEQELETYLKQFMVALDTGKGGTALSISDEMVFVRDWLVAGVPVGKITSHGFDDFRVDSDRNVTIVEYKTTSQKIIDWYKLSTAIFQLKVYAWMLEPLLKQGGYKISKLEIVYLPQPKRGQKNIPPPHEQEPLGVKTIYDYSAAAVESDIAMIFKEFGNPGKMQPPARFKCYGCHPNFKSRCPLQGMGQ